MPCEPNEKVCTAPDTLRIDAHTCVPLYVGQGELVTNKEGLLVMQSLPNVFTELPIEPWKPQEPDPEQGVGRKEAWHRKKVMSDIRAHTVIDLEYPAKIQEQWAALDMFHDMYPTSDSLPTSLPISLKPPGASQEWEMKYGTPCDWQAGWEKLTLRYER